MEARGGQPECWRGQAKGGSRGVKGGQRRTVTVHQATLLHHLVLRNGLLLLQGLRELSGALLPAVASLAKLNHDLVRSLHTPTGRTQGEWPR